MMASARKILRLTSNKLSNNSHFIASINSVSFHFTSNKRSNDRHIIASINSVSLLVRRKILRLYF